VHAVIVSPGIVDPLFSEVIVNGAANVREVIEQIVKFVPLIGVVLAMRFPTSQIHQLGPNFRHP